MPDSAQQETDSESFLDDEQATKPQRAFGDGSEAIRVLAGDCTVVYDDGNERKEHRGRVTTVIKPDGTVLVHDSDGYQPVAWLTRAASVLCSRDGHFSVDARDGSQRLRVLAHREDGFASYPATAAGVPVGQCPSCGGSLVRATGTVVCIDCDDRYGLPAGATVRGEQCSCGLPRLRVERGVPLSVCLDHSCEPLVDAVRAEFDREWDCPTCGSALRVLERGGLLVGCDAYPDCETSFSIPVGTIVEDCACGLPIFETASGRRCLDSNCEQPLETPVQ
jgi:DNA topoisomerase-1